MSSKVDSDLTLENVKDHPILRRVLQRIEQQLASGAEAETTAHTAHNSHYSSLTKEERPASKR